MKRVIVLDPLSAITRMKLGMCYLLARCYPEAIAQLQKCLELEHNFFPAYNDLGMALLLSDRADEAIATWKHAYEGGRQYHSLAGLAYGYARKGDRAQAFQILRQLEESEGHGTRAWPLGRALVYLALETRTTLCNGCNAGPRRSKDGDEKLGSGNARFLARRFFDM